MINLQEGCDGGIRWCGRATEEHMHRDKNYKKVVVVMEGSGGVVGLLRNICTETKITKRLWL